MAKKKIGKKACVKLARQLARTTGVCSKCGRTKAEVQIQASHILPEEYHWTSCHPLNMIELCASCHKFGKDSWHKNPMLMAKWFSQHYPGRHADLQEFNALMTDQFGPTPNWAEVHTQLKSEIKRRKEEQKNADK